ncbi:hypothetical protein ACFWP5_08770 [Streptomyces sp. NPDC058469]|uniref:hypothetical protein n=1 Tax=Streptomyces sp. NPDC058469 TaxID=3346514 RepID=UPI0036519915
MSEFNSKETVETTLPLSGKVVVLKKYLSGFDVDAIEDVLLDGAETDDNGKSKFSGALVRESTSKALEVTVLTVDGAPYSLEVLRAYPAKDYKSVIAKVKEIRDASDADPKA